MGDASPICVTGGAGYIGSVLTERLLALGHPVTVLDTLSFTDRGLAHLRGHPGLRIVEGDIRDPSAVRHAFEGAWGVVHLAAVANDPSGDLDPRLTRSINLDPYPTLLKAARRAGVRRFVNASTFSVYGIQDAPDVTEDHPLRPLKEYSICKAKAEPLVADADGGGLTTVSLRCATVCGWSGRMRFDLIVNTLVGMAVRDGRLTVWGGAQQRPQIHVEDMADAFITMLEAPAGAVGGKIFNVGGENASILGIARTIAQRMGGIEVEEAPAREDERSYHVNWDRIASAVGFRARRPIASAVEGILAAREAGLWTDASLPIYSNLKHMAALGVG